MLGAAGGPDFPLWSTVPFAGLLVAIAIMPLVAEHWWHGNRNKALVSVCFALPALVYVSHRDPAALARTALEYAAFVCLLFAATGELSAVLDNAPTYLAFLSMAQYLPDEVAGTTHRMLSAISCGAVFFGAMTYIDGPSFMVRAIAEQAGVRVPSFFGYAGWSLAAIGPILVAVAVLFFR